MVLSSKRLVFLVCETDSSPTQFCPQRQLLFSVSVRQTPPYAVLSPKTVFAQCVRQSGHTRFSVPKDQFCCVCETDSSSAQLLSPERLFLFSVCDVNLAAATCRSWPMCPLKTSCVIIDHLLRNLTARPHEGEGRSVAPETAP